MCIFVEWQDDMKMTWCLSIPRFPEYTPRRSFHFRYHCIPIHPPSILNDVLRGHDRASLRMQLAINIEYTQRYTLRPWSGEFGHAFGDRDRVNWEIHLEAMIDRVWRCTGRPWSSEFGDSLGGRDRSNLDMHWVVMIERVWTCTWRPRSSELTDALPGYDWGRLEEYLEAVNLDGGAMAAETPFIC